jgi:hypothetical protein
MSRVLLAAALLSVLVPVCDGTRKTFSLGGIGGDLVQTGGTGGVAGGTSATDPNTSDVTVDPGRRILATPTASSPA